MTADLALEIARLAADQALTTDAALERTAKAIVARNDSHQVVALAWALLYAVRREGEIDWATDGLEPAAPDPPIGEAADLIAATLRGLSSNEARTTLAFAAGQAFAGSTDDDFGAFVRLADEQRKVAQGASPALVN